MKAVIQRVNYAQVRVAGNVVGDIQQGLCILLGISASDTEEDATWLVGKIVQMRIFSDEQGKMNLSVKDTNGDILLISQFTLMALTHKGNRPSFIKAAAPNVAIPLYSFFKNKLEAAIGKPVASGIFGADMQVLLENNGPVTITIDSHEVEIK